MSTYLVTHTATVKDSFLNVFSPLGSLVDRPFCQIDFIAHLKGEGERKERYQTFVSCQS